MFTALIKKTFCGFSALIIVGYAVAHTLLGYIVGHTVGTVFILVAHLKFHFKRGNRPKLNMY